MSTSRRLALAVGAFAAASFAPVALRAQAAAGPNAATDSLAFPRQFVKWALSGQGDSVFVHSAPRLQEAMKSPQNVNAMGLQITSKFGEPQGTAAELQFEESGHKVYIVVTRYSQAPEPGAFLVNYAPGTRVADGALFTSLSNIKTHYPQLKLP
jgi:hypothetical protein